MPIINATIRWADNTEQLRQRLKEGINTIDAMKAAVDKTVQSLGGQGLFQAANKVTAALIEMGGAQKLTRAEQERINTLLEKAIEKYRLMGQTAPEAMIKLAAETKKVTTATLGLVDGMSQVGKAAAESSRASATLISGLSGAGRDALAKPFIDAAAASKQMVSGMGAIGAKAVESSALIQGMSQSGKAGILGLAAATEKPLSAFTTLATAARALAPALTVGFAVKTIVDFAKEAVASADALQKMADKTGIGVEGLQRLQIVGDEAGNTIDQLTGAVNQMQRRLSDGDASAVGALKKLGLELSDLRNLAPDQQFMAIADALRQVKDPADQVNLAMDLFGRQGAEVLPSIKRGFDDVRDASVGMSEATVKALDEAGDAWERWKRRVKGEIAEVFADLIEFERKRQAAIEPEPQVLPLPEGAQRFQPIEIAESISPAANRLRQDLEKLKVAADAFRKTDTGVGLLKPDAYLEAAGAIEKYLTTTARATKVNDEAARKLAEVNEKIQDLRRGLSGITAEQQAQILTYHELGLSADDIATKLKLSTVAVNGVIDATKKMSEVLKTGSEAMKLLGDTGSTAAGMIVDEFGKALLTMEAFTASVQKTAKFDLSGLFDMGRIEPPKIEDLGIKAKVLGEFSEAFAGLPDLLVKAFTGGGNWAGAFKALATKITDGLFGKGGALEGVTKAVTKWATNILSGLGQSLSGLLGKLIGDFLPIAGPLIVEGVKKLFGKLAGRPSEAELGARGEQADLIKMFRDAGHAGTDFEVIMGGVQEAVAEVGGSAEDARVLVEGLLDTHHPERYKRAVESLNQVLDEGKKRWQAVGEAIQALNAFSTEGIDTQGKFNTAAATAIALFDDWVRKTGDVLGAIEQLSPTLDALKDSQETLGFTGSEAIDKLLRIREVAEANQPLIDNIKQSTLLIEALGRTGDLTGDLLIKFGQNAVNQFTLLKQATGDEMTALSLMAPELQKLWEHQQKFHDITDQSTLALLDLAETQGVVGEDMKDVNEQILDVLKLIAQALGADLPRAAQAGADGVNRALDRIPRRKVIDVDVNYNDPGYSAPTPSATTTPTEPSGSTPISPTPIGTAVPRIRAASTGGYVTQLGIQPLHMATGGLVPPQPTYLQAGNLANAPTMFPSRGTDTVHAMLTPGELVLSENQQRGELVQPVVNAIEKLRADVKILQQLTGVKGDTVVEVDGRELVRAANRVWDNGGTVRTASREALGIES